MQWRADVFIAIERLAPTIGSVVLDSLIMKYAIHLVEFRFAEATRPFCFGSFCHNGAS